MDKFYNDNAIGRVDDFGSAGTGVRTSSMILNIIASIFFAANCSFGVPAINVEAVGLMADKTVFPFSRQSDKTHGMVALVFRSSPLLPVCFGQQIPKILHSRHKSVPFLFTVSMKELTSINSKPLVSNAFRSAVAVIAVDSGVDKVMSFFILIVFSYLKDPQGGFLSFERHSRERAAPSQWGVTLPATGKAELKTGSFIYRRNAPNQVG